MKGWSHVMALSQDGIHPYVYARVLGIFRLNILHGPTMVDEETMDVLWVRWFRSSPSWMESEAALLCQTHPEP